MKISFTTNNKEIIDIIKTTSKAYNIKCDIQDFTYSTYITLFDVKTIDYNVEKEILVIAYNNIGIRCNIKDIQDMFIDTIQ